MFLNYSLLKMITSPVLNHTSHHSFEMDPNDSLEPSQIHCPKPPPHTE